MTRKKVSQLHSELQRVLIAIRGAGSGIAEFRIAKETGMDSSAVGDAVKRLLEANMIAVYPAKREKDARDGREYETYCVPVRRRSDG